MVKQLRDSIERKRSNDAGNMATVAGTRSDADMEDIGEYVAGLH